MKKFALSKRQMMKFMVNLKTYKEGAKLRLTDTGAISLTDKKYKDVDKWRNTSRKSSLKYYRKMKNDPEFRRKEREKVIKYRARRREILKKLTVI